jgi:diguanylate cyclase (GGDEF)-like protein
MVCIAALTVALLVAALLAARLRAALSDASTDALTGVGNRRAADRALFSRRAPAAVVLADLDSLRVINKQLGHAAGDDLLRRAARAMCDAALPGDTVARVGGDELLLVAGPGHRDAEGLTLRVELAMRSAGVGASVGAADVGGRDDVRAALERADRAARTAKARQHESTDAEADR